MSHILNTLSYYGRRRLKFNDDFFIKLIPNLVGIVSNAKTKLPLTQPEHRDGKHISIFIHSASGNSERFGGADQHLGPKVQGTTSTRSSGRKFTAQDGSLTA